MSSAAGDEELQLRLRYPWVQFFDQQSGNHYFSNPLTGETSWDPPPDAYDYAPQVPDLQDELVEELPPGWVTGFDSSVGAVYYCHEESGQCQWAMPRVGDDDDAAGSPAGPQATASKRDASSREPALA